MIAQFKLQINYACRKQSKYMRRKKEAGVEWGGGAGGSPSAIIKEGQGQHSFGPPIIHPYFPSV